MRITTGFKAAGAAVATLMLLAGCQNKASGTSASKSTWSRMESDIISTMDPSKSTDAISGTAINDTTDGLYRYSGTELKPAIATKIVKPTKNGTVYTFKLRDAKWSNGDPVTADDFVFAWRRTVDPATKSQYAYLYSGVVNADAVMKGTKKPATLGVKALDKHTLQVTLEHPIPYFQKMMVNGPFFPQNEKYVKKMGSKYGTQAKYTLANGPYKLTGWNGSNNSWQEVKNPTYWNAKNVHIDQINVTAVKDATTAMNLFQSGKLDDAALTGDQAAQAKTQKDYRGIKQTSVFYLELNEKKVPAFKNTKLRQAMSMAINREEYIKKVLQDGSIDAPTVTPSGLAENPTTKEDFSKEAAQGYTKYTSYNPKEAKALWTAGMQEVGKQNLTLELLTDDTDNAKRSAEYFQNTLEKNLPGLKVTISTVPFKTRLTRSQDGQFDMVLSGWSADFTDPITFLDLFTTDGSYNDGKWSNATFDKLINESQTTYATNETKRWQVMVQAQQLLTQEQGVIPIYQRVQAHLVNPKIQGLKTTPGGTFDLIGAKIKK
ncbi:peptide ABC transporter substrate-binding protein [Schleiferilactobacillus harbinensis]|jgi:oligopeptide transport system substrate-binding protein|uniref:peptide ABC transporter substrate-binding protein n=1 Tax=Schleiferilactobacillus harbinensis TaxID=304207 RepID=UPI0007B9BE11|nr:peptide ABC transporter substrate-binding protein [Schleiferilactobacillus harbinensis]MCI1687702.1 peptide ABC transporter substrate-binding protein [Schleiferilactobacillus harbinensis]MCI1783406.1 peptide ABC transporter substrate-binding protein [Schleiferilactobacillus harbinensis]MCI1849757.1 peptide ABC transporter substrate-binding protein [Schleiferilactobacillus harbinensis]QEU48498.1 peptide ABC transporter substrate-binding protein [Schleiferilactobacillus harbinensis]